MFLRQGFDVSVVRTEQGHVAFIPSVSEGDTGVAVVTLCGQRDRQVPYGTPSEEVCFCADCYSPFREIAIGYYKMTLTRTCSQVRVERSL